MKSLLTSETFTVNGIDVKVRVFDSTHGKVVLLTDQGAKQPITAFMDDIILEVVNAHKLISPIIFLEHFPPTSESATARVCAVKFAITDGMIGEMEWTRLLPSEVSALIGLDW